ncbi:MAG: hypothetical protein AAFQ09_10760 [Pseudomonadota bacterium]
METIAALQQIVRHEDATLGRLIRDAVKRNLYRRSKANTAQKADERFVVPWRALLADDLAYAEGWDDLQDRLTRKGYQLQEGASGLGLNDLAGKRICMAFDLGYGYSERMRRFRAPFPEQSRQYFFRKALVD